MEYNTDAEWDATIAQLMKSDCPCCRLRGRLLRDMAPPLRREIDRITSQEDAKNFQQTLPDLFADLLMTAAQLVAPAEQGKLVRQTTVQARKHVDEALARKTQGGRA